MTTEPGGDVGRPLGPDGTELTAEEWDAVRRLRGERPATEPEQETAAQPVPQTVAEPLPPVAPTPPPEQVAEPVTEAVTEEQAAPVPAAERPRTRRGSSRSGPVASTLAALVVLALTATVLAALTGVKVSDQRSRDRASTAALAAATTGVATVLSYNYRSLGADFAKAEALLTPGFRKAYDATTAKAVQPLAAKYQAVSTAQVSAAGVISASTGRATVLVFVSQQVTNTQLSAPRLDRSRIEVDLVHSHGRWLINKLTPV